LKQLKVAHVADTDLPEACGISLYPCVSKIGGCALERIVPSAGGKLTPDATTCNCFNRGFSEPIDVPNRPDVVISCSFQCVETILKYTDLYLIGANGRGNGLAGKCSTSIDVLGAAEYANRNDYIPTDSDTDRLEVLPVDDPRVVRAAAALAQHVAAARASACPDKPAVADEAAASVVYAKRGPADGGRGQYKLEALLGGEVFFARVAHLPAPEQLVDPARAGEDPRNYGGRLIDIYVYARARAHTHTHTHKDR
jgi:hypothetical protein